MLQLGSQNGVKIEKKIETKNDQNFDASWDRFWGGFSRIWGAKMEPCWHPNGAQDGCYLENTEKTKYKNKMICEAKLCRAEQGGSMVVLAYLLSVAISSSSSVY